MKRIPTPSLVPPLGLRSRTERSSIANLYDSIVVNIVPIGSLSTDGSADDFDTGFGRADRESTDEQ